MITKPVVKFCFVINAWQGCMMLRILLNIYKVTLISFPSTKVIFSVSICTATNKNNSFDKINRKTMKYLITTKLADTQKHTLTARQKAQE